MKYKIDLRNKPDILDIINAILENDGVVEVKIEHKDGKKKIAVVEQVRKLKSIVDADC